MLCTATLVVSQSGSTREIPLDPKGKVIGRDAHCAIVLDSPGVSRRHARIFADPFGRWIIEDLDSHNGTWVNSRRITAPGFGAWRGGNY